MLRFNKNWILLPEQHSTTMTYIRPFTFWIFQLCKTKGLRICAPSSNVRANFDTHVSTWHTLETPTTIHPVRAKWIHCVAHTKTDAEASQPGEHNQQSSHLATPTITIILIPSFPEILVQSTSTHSGGQVKFWNKPLTWLLNHTHTHTPGWKCSPGQNIPLYNQHCKGSI